MRSEAEAAQSSVNHRSTYLKFKDISQALWHRAPDARQDHVQQLMWPVVRPSHTMWNWSTSPGKHLTPCREPPVGWLLMHGGFVVCTLYYSGFLIKMLCGTNSHAVQTSITTTRLPLSTELIISLKEDVSLVWQDLLPVHPAWLALFRLPFLHLLIESLISCPIIFPNSSGSLAARCSQHRVTWPLPVLTEHQGSWTHGGQIF